MAKKRIQTRTQGEWWKFLGLGALILIVYANSFAAGFVFDSVPIIQDDPRLRQLTFDNLAKIFTLNYWWPSQYTPLYRPLTTLTYLFNYAVLGGGESVDRLPYREFSAALDECLARFRDRSASCRAMDVAALTACLFAVHPANTEAVTNIVGRADLLATLCVLFGGWCYLKALENGARWKSWLALLAVSSCLGVVAKENAVMIVGFIALYDFYGDGPRDKDRIHGFGAALHRAGSIAAVDLVHPSMDEQPCSGFRRVLHGQSPDRAPPLQGFMAAAGVVGRYLQLLVFPRTLSSDYSFNQIHVQTDLYAIISLAAVAILIATALRLRQRQRLFSWGILFLFGMMLPTSNLAVKIGSIMAERFLYLPSIGFCAVAALGCARLVKGWEGRGACPIGAPCVGSHRTRLARLCPQHRVA